MKLLALNCNHCGAPLEAPARAQYLTCEYCNVRLAIKRAGKAVYTDVLDQIDSRTERIEQKVDRLTTLKEVELLDREWATHREQYLVKDKDGEASVPTVAGGILTSILSVVVGGGFITLLCVGIWRSGSTSILQRASNDIGPTIFMVIIASVVLLFTIGGILVGVGTVARAREYEATHNEYQQRRHGLLSRPGKPAAGENSAKKFLCFSNTAGWGASRVDPDP